MSARTTVTYPADPRPRLAPVPDPAPSTVRGRTIELPEPPTDEERDLYLGPQRRWVIPVSFLCYVLIVISIGFFVARHIWAVVLVLPLIVSAVGTTISLVTSSRRRRDTLEGHRAKVASWNPAHVPSIDVFLPSAGEDLAVLSNTYRHVSALQWRGEVNVLVLDDSAREDVRRLAHGARLHLPEPTEPRLVQEGREPEVRLRALRRRRDPRARRGLRASPRRLDRARPVSRRSRDRHRAEPAVLRQPLADELDPAGGRRDADPLLPLGAAVPGPQPGRDLRRDQRPLPAGRTRRCRRLRAHRTQRGRPHRRQPDASRLRGQVCPDDRHQGPVPGHDRPVRDPAVPLVHRLDEPAVLTRLPPAATDVDAAAQLLVRLPVLHHHGCERVRHRACRRS